MLLADESHFWATLLIVRDFWSYVVTRHFPYNTETPEIQRHKRVTQQLLSGSCYLKVTQE